MTEPEQDAFLDRLWEAWSYWIKNERGGTSQGKLAEAVAAESGQPTRQEDVSRWLKGKGRPSYEELPATARALGVRYQWLGFNDGPMTEEGHKVYIKPAVTKTPKELEKPKVSRRKGTG